MAHQPEPTLIELFHYNHWANQELMAICLGVDAAILTASMPGAYGSIPATFAHILQAEISFLKRMQQAYPEAAFKWEPTPQLADLAAYEIMVSNALLDALQTVPATRHVHEAGDGWTFDYHARLIFMSVVYHGIAHRTDITTLLASHGVRLPELDVWGYCAAHPDRFQSSIVQRDQ